MSLEDDILEDIEGEKPKSTIKVHIPDKGDSFEPQRRVTAQEIQKERMDRLQKERRQKNLANKPADKLKRHAVIKALIDTGQVKENSPKDIQRALKDKGIDVSGVTVWKDLNEITRISPESMNKIDNMLVGTLKSYLSRLDTIAEESDNDETRIRAINAAFDDTRKLYDILDTIAQRTILEETERLKLGKLGNPINEIIQFIDSPERVNKDIYYVDERNKIMEWLQEEIGTMIEREGRIYDTFSNPTAGNTFRKATDDVLEIIKRIKESPYRKKKVQQEGKDSEDSIKMDK